jgi:hypothetical protein
MGRVLGHVMPTLMHSARINYATPELFLDMRKDPPEYLGMGSTASHKFDGKSWEFTTVWVRGRPWIGGGFWAPTRRGVRTYLYIDPTAFLSLDTAEFRVDPERAHTIRRVALEGMRRDAPDHPWLEPPGLDTAPFDARSGFTTVPVRSSHIHWWGYFWNVCTLATLAMAARAFWPCHKRRLPLIRVRHA